MNHRKKRKKIMCYPEDAGKANWDLFVTVILVFTCVMTPVNMAFDEDLGVEWDWILGIIDFLFLIDVFITFISAIEDEDFIIIEKYKTLAIIYLRSWFFLDMLAIIPFDAIMMSSI